ncbi:DUF378 domain-containing protein [Frigidibacter sp. SD6-1]|uniref:DUF378 domain-containing protein n=1 Tax=Frigidibacter sp. SD6-1 TaxID=3032581 RepID=UPI0024DF482B|nr:DUF378 domain-containing protein [Frigidibacter sp. SD6-1]
MRTMDVVSLILVIVGGLNWLLVGLFEFDLVAAIFGGQLAALSRIVYVLVGVAAVWLIFAAPRLVPGHRAPPV